MDDHGANTLHTTVLLGRDRRSGHATVTKQPLPAPCNVDLLNKNGCTLLHVAVTYGHATVTEQLIVARGNVDLQANNGGTPLHITVHEGYVSVTKELLTAHCNVDLQTKKDLTALQFAEGQGHPGIATLIRNKSRRHRCLADAWSSTDSSQNPSSTGAQARR